MATKQSVINKRQFHYWKGIRFEKENNFYGAIESYLEYSEHLDSKDRHIPHLWISKLYSEIGKLNLSLIHLEKYAEGCNDLIAAEVYKEIGERYLDINAIEKTISCYEKAIILDPKIGLKKKLEYLKNNIL